MVRWNSCACLMVAAALAAGVTRADPVPATKQWTNCQGGEGIWPEMRISGCNEVIKSGKATGSDLAKAYYLRGNAYLARSEYMKAIDDYDRALEIQKDEANALSERCWALAVLGIELDSALSDCNEALRLKAGDSETLGARGFTYMRLGLYRTAVLDYDAALKVKADNALHLYARGMAKIRAGEQEAGEADLAAARAADPKAEAAFERVDQANQTGFWASVASYWRAAMKWVY